MDEHDGLDDAELAAALRERADSLTADVVDTDAAFGAVTQRARIRRFRRGAASGALAVAAAAVGVLVVTSVAGDEQVVRTPATSPTAPATVTIDRPAPPTTVVDTTTVASSTTIPSTTVPSVAPTVAAPIPPAATTTAPQSPPPTSAATATTYNSSGGSITVRLAGGAIALAGEPSPRAGYSVRIDDNGPDRVGVRFESDTGRSEIRVDLESGRLVPEIIEG